MEQADRTLINDLKPIISDLLTFTDTIIPDAKETVRKYADVKFEYLRKDIKIRFTQTKTRSSRTNAGLIKPKFASRSYSNISAPGS